ncbi:MAG: histidine phosphatase family protein [Candidatus Thorarchaeota archaeon]
MLGTKNEWETKDWLHSARKLVEWASETQTDSRIMLLVRHSHREEIEDHSAQLSTELTPLGILMSTEMGRRLPAGRKTHIFFSFVSRCYQTAEEIGNGIVEKGGRIDEMDYLPVLSSPMVNDDRFWNGLQPDGKNITDFVNNWGQGVYGEYVEPFDAYGMRLLNDTIERLRGAAPGTMHIHITHDLALMAAKRILLGRAVGSQDREPFLGGIGIIITGNQTQMYNAGSVHDLDSI